MNFRKILILALIIAIIVAVSIGIINMLNTNKEEIATNDITDNTTNITELSETHEGEVEDECLNEWDDYNKYVNKQIQETSNNLSENDTHYILKDVLGYIEVYYLDENNNEYLYKKTTIPTTYLSQEDIEDLKVGIEVTGIEALNKMLEDFE